MFERVRPTAHHSIPRAHQVHLPFHNNIFCHKLFLGFKYFRSICGCCYHTPPVAPLPDNPSGRQRHQKVGTIDGSLRQGRHRLADMKRLLEMRIQHLEDAKVIYFI
jgi:hypothetical protein